MPAGRGTTYPARADTAAPGDEKENSRARCTRRQRVSECNPSHGSAPQQTKRRISQIRTTPNLARGCHVFCAVFFPVLRALLWVNWWKRQPFAPRMEMHCVPRSGVLAILAEGGGRLVDTQEELMPAGFQSCRYWVGKG